MACNLIIRVNQTTVLKGKAIRNQGNFRIIVFKNILFHGYPKQKPGFKL
jgi:hypothetical protein